MIGLDTNVLVRYFTQDDASQSRSAERIIDALTSDDPGFVSLVALAEVAWVFKTVYRLQNDEITPIIDGMLSAQEFRLEQAECVRQAARAAKETSVGFADALTSSLGAAAGCETTFTFDRAAAKLPGMTLLKASKTA
ncbi:MAG: type II toxin-antitoxin system VapC family toxin [Aeromicrobium sp.]